MSTINAFHEVQFPNNLARGATGGPERRTEVISLGSGREQRNTRWAHSRRRYNAGYGIKTLEDLQQVIEFFEERRGRLFGFRFRDPLDWKSARGLAPVDALDQFVAVADGQTSTFQLIKQYGDPQTGYVRQIAKPVQGSVQIAVDGITVPQTSYTLDYTLGQITFYPQSEPVNGAEIRAGFEFDVPVRFDADEITVNLSHFEAGDIPSIPLMELLP